MSLVPVKSALYRVSLVTALPVFKLSRMSFQSSYLSRLSRVPSLPLVPTCSRPVYASQVTCLPLVSFEPSPSHVSVVCLSFQSIHLGVACGSNHCPACRSDRVTSVSRVCRVISLPVIPVESPLWLSCLHVVDLLVLVESPACPSCQPVKSPLISCQSSNLSVCRSSKVRSVEPPVCLSFHSSQVYIVSDSSHRPVSRSSRVASRSSRVAVRSIRVACRSSRATPGRMCVETPLCVSMSSRPIYAF